MDTITYRHSAIAFVWIALGIAIWFAAVPAWISPQTFGWLNAAAICLGAIIVTTVRSAGPTRSIAQVIYDTEHRPNPGR